MLCGVKFYIKEQMCIYKDVKTDFDKLKKIQG